MKKCTNCGATLNDNFKFCPECGLTLSKPFDTKNKSEEVAASQARKSIVRGILSIVFSNFAFPVGMIIGLVLSNNARRFAKWVFDECPNSPSVAMAKIGKTLGDIGTILSLASVFVFFGLVIYSLYINYYSHPFRIKLSINKI